MEQRWDMPDFSESVKSKKMTNNSYNVLYCKAYVSKQGTVCEVQKIPLIRLLYHLGEELRVLKRTSCSFTNVTILLINLYALQAVMLAESNSSPASSNSNM